MLVVARLTSGKLSLPIQVETHSNQLFLCVFNVRVCPLLGWYPSFNRCILSRKPERVPAHRVNNLLASLFVVAGEYVAYSVDAYMTHVYLAGRIWELTKAVNFVTVINIANTRLASFLGPDRLPLLLYLLHVICDLA